MTFSDGQAPILDACRFPQRPLGLADLRNLTPGDFAVVARQLRFAPARNAEEIVERLVFEAAAKPESGGRIGF